MSEIRILSAGAVKRGVAHLAEAFAREHGYRVTVEFATAPELASRMQARAEVDVLVAPVGLVEALSQSGRVAPESRRAIGRSRMGMVVHARSNAACPAEVEAFRTMLSSAHAVVRNKASSGLYAAKLLADLGLDAALGPRIVVVASGARVMEHVAAHEGAVGLAQVSEIRVQVDKGLPVKLLGPLPDAIQNFTRYEAAAVAGRAQEAQATSLAQFLATSEAKAVFAASGID